MMQAVQIPRPHGAPSDADVRMLTAQELLAGGLLVHEIEVPAPVLSPGGNSIGGKVRLRPLKVGTLALISNASREDPSMVPVLMIKDSLVEPVLTIDQIRQMHAGLMHFLMESINRISGLDSDAVHLASTSSLSEAHVQLARHFGWTPAQVAELTPGQVAVYLAGIERLLALGAEGRAER